MRKQDGATSRCSMNKKYELHGHPIKFISTWHSPEGFKRGKFNSIDSAHQQNCVPRGKVNHEGTCERKVTRWGVSSGSCTLSSLFTVPNNRSTALISEGNQLPIICALRRWLIYVLILKGMVRKGNRNTSANKYLKHAWEAYETRTSQKEKLKIEELESEEEENWRRMTWRRKLSGSKILGRRLLEQLNMSALRRRCGA